PVPNNLVSRRLDHCHSAPRVPDHDTARVCSATSLPGSKACARRRMTYRRSLGSQVDRLVSDWATVSCLHSDSGVTADLLETVQATLGPRVLPRSARCAGSAQSTTRYLRRLV